MRDLKIRSETMELLEESIEEKLLHISVGNDFLHMTPKVQAKKAESNEWGCIKLKSFFCKAKEQSTKISAIEQEKIFSHSISEKRFVSKLCKELIQLNNEEFNQLINYNHIEKWMKNLYRYFI